MLSAIVFASAGKLLALMAATPDIREQSKTYIRIESIANVFGVLAGFTQVALITIGKSKYIYLLTVLRLAACSILDTFLVSSLDISAQLGVNGIGISNIIVNIFLFAISIVLLARSGCNILKREKLSFAWAKDFVKVGSISGLESFVRNFAYMVMIARMVNVVNEQGTYWVANSFIWGWLLLPINQLAELIKQETGKNEEAVKNNTLGYFAITVFTCLVWAVTIPLYKSFMRHVLQFGDVDKLFSLVMLLLPFYVLYALQNVFDATFYGLGKTEYMLAESLVTNTIYYGAAFILYAKGLWTPTLPGIALLFGIGNAFDSIVSAVAYAVLLKKKGIRIL